jgi:hypothetical protein
LASAKPRRIVAVIFELEVLVRRLGGHASPEFGF